MGEWSKSVGEEGEKIVEYLFENILGYKTLRKKNSISCNNGEKHKMGDGPKTSHGIDGLITVHSPLQDKVLDVGIISVKFTANEYPKAPKGDFKKHFKDLVYTLECYENSKLNSEINRSFSNVTKTDITGILVWASNESDLDFDVISKVSNMTVSSDYHFNRIIVLDNARITFFVNLIENVKNKFKQGIVSFVYHNSGLNSLSLESNSYGEFLPIQYLFSDIIPLRVEIDNKVTFIIGVRDNFKYEDLLRIFSFVKSFDHLDSSSNVIITFPDYNETKNSSDVEKALSFFGNDSFKSNLTVTKHTLDFKNR
ncbi:GapS4a family protein [Flavobacterium tistrianum]|uniref:GapS4a family protein n=1 Tax=Flavobacterium tistrianum TaxID=1685414 RepID=UPI000DABF0C4|nr:hypothetical protein [Flavobacterium tistrianum]KAF2339429.1 hypothetical protein DMB71_18260 [Flavobacterium tistrianum]